LEVTATCHAHIAPQTDRFVIYRARSDGQNCYNTWPFLPGHGAEWSGNKCILSKSTNLGNPGDGIVPALHCPGPAETVVAWNKSETTTDTWRAQCGLDLMNNEYYTSNVSGTWESINSTRAFRMPALTHYICVPRYYH